MTTPAREGGGQPDGEAGIDCRYGRMAIVAGDTILGRSLQEYGEWAQAEIELLGDLLHAGDVVLDVGAFIGTHTLAFASFVGAAGRVISFEPHPLHFGLLRANVAANGCANVHLVAAGVAAREGTMSLHLQAAPGAANPGGASLQDADAAGGAVPVRTIDGLGLERCALIKIDVEGMESEVIAGALATLERLRPIVYAECNAVAQGWAVVERLRACGYLARLFNFAAYRAQNYRANPANFLGEAREAGLLLVPAERRAALDGLPARADPLIPIECLDDLVLGMLKKPQYKSEVLARSAAAGVVGVDFFLVESEARYLRREADAMVQAQARAQAQVQEWQGRYERIASSPFWRLSAPLRALRELLRRTGSTGS